MSTKKAIKSIKSQIEEKNHETALYEATALLKSLKKEEPEVPQVLCLRGLALNSLERSAEAEKCYAQAYKIAPGHPLATTALTKLYEKQKEWAKLCRFLETIVQETYHSNDGEGCAKALQQLLVLRQQHGPEDRLIATLHLLLPSSPLVPLLRDIPAPAGTYTPLAAPLYPPMIATHVPTLPSPLPHALHLVSSLPLLMYLLVRQEHLIHTKLESDVKAARMKLGKKSEKETRRDVECDVLGGELGMELVELLKEVAAHPSVEESVRREVEIRECEFWRKLVGVLPVESAKPAAPGAKAKPTKATAPSSDDSSIDLPPTPLFEHSSSPKPTKAEALSRAQALADGFILLKVGGPAEASYQFALDGLDQADIYYPLDLLHQYATLFPDSSLTAFIDDYCRWFKLPLPDPEDDDAGENADRPDGSAKKDEKKAKGHKAWKKKNGMNAKDRRRARRTAGKEGTLEEDVEGEEREELVASMTKVLDKLPTSIFAHRVMAAISVHEEDWANAVAYAEKARILLRDLEGERGISMPITKSSLDTVLGLALVPYFPPKHHTRASRLLNGVLSTDQANTAARFARAQVFQYAGNWNEARKNFQKILDLPESTEGSNVREEQQRRVAAREEVAWCLVNEGSLEGGREILEAIVQERDEKWEADGKKEGQDALIRARAWWRLGRTEWLIGDDEAKANAEEWFSASLRAMPTFAPSFTSLGVLYESASPPDVERAIKCFQKAFELDATEAEAAEKLARGYADEDEWALVRTIAMRVMEGEGGVEGVRGGEVLSGKERFAPKNGWAWKALGSTEMHYKNYAKAAQAFQIALRASPDDMSLYLLLGESYVKCGRHVAAIKTLERVIEVDSTNWMARYDIGDIQYELGNFDVAITAFEELVNEKPDEIGALGGLAQAQLAMGRKMVDGGFRERARTAFIQAIQVAERVLKLDRTWRAWGWKIVGDAAFEVGNLAGAIDEDAAEAALRSVMEWLVKDDEDKRSTVPGLGHPSTLLSAAVSAENFVSRSAVFAFAYRSYLLRDERSNVSMSALYDLATSLHALSQRTKDEKERRELVKSAVTTIRLALEKDAGDERLWNALAVLCTDGGEQVAQHAYVISLELYQKDPITWTNLGYLYLRLDDRELANQCFLKAQVIDPDYAKAWLGQGLLAERNKDRDHARGIFAHSVTLSAGALLESDLAAAALIFERYLTTQWLDIGELHQPAFALKRYVQQRPADSAAVHLYGLICERLGLIAEAVSAIERATTLLEEEFEATETTAIEIRYSIALANLGRARLAARAYDEALSAYTNCWELIEGSQESQVSSLRVQVKLGQALAQCWLDETEASLELFQQALDEAEGSGVSGLKEEVAVLLARTLWGMGAEGQEMAKSHLMECLSGDSPSLKVIATLGAIAISTSDGDLLEAVSSELSSLPAHKRAEDRADLAGLVLSTNSVIHGEVEEALSSLATALQTDPWNTEIRARIAKMHLSTGQTEDAANILLMDMRDTEGALVGLRGVSRVMNADPDGLSEVQRGVRARPWEDRPWEELGWARGILHESGIELGGETNEARIEAGEGAKEAEPQEDKDEVVTEREKDEWW